MLRYLVFLALFLFSASASAFFGEANGFYFSDALSNSSQTSYAREFADAALGFNIDRHGYFQAGWGYDIFDTSDKVGGTTTVYAATAMGPKFNFYMGRHRHWSLGAFYGIVSSAKYGTGSASTETWSGTTIKVDLGYLIPITDSGESNVGVRLNYVTSNYTSKLVNSTTYSNISYSRSFIYPSLYIGFEF